PRRRGAAAAPDAGHLALRGQAVKLALLALLLLAEADAGVGPDRVRITVRSIAASNAPGGFDEKLAAIAPHLKNMPFRSYKLLQERRFDLDWKTPAELELPGSRSLQVVPRQLAP